MVLKTVEQLGWNASDADRLRDRQRAMIALGGYALLSLIWAFAADAPWDDDCPTRFFNTQNAFRAPENFVSLWNRPLFVLLFALPSQLGKDVVPVLMTLISTMGAWLLWRGVQLTKAPHAWLVIPFMAMQPFFFGTSRVALTEPLAAVLLCAGFFFLMRKQWHWYALMGGLLPLARLELSVVLLLWVWPLIQAKQWKHLAWMALPMVLWNLAAGIIVGDFNYVFNSTFGADSGVNRYGHTTFGHYFRRTMWVTGPVVFYFLLQGLVFRALRKGWTLWVDGQLVLGLLLYVLFSWKLSMGQAAGFLRNLVPLTPLVALIALDGYNQVISILMGKAGPSGQSKSDGRILAGVSVLAVVLGFAFFAQRLDMHQLVTPFRDNSLPVATVALIVGLGIVYGMVRSKKYVADKIAPAIAVAMASGLAAFTLYQEPPNASNNADRQAMGIIADFYKDSELHNRPTYVNHNWFFWRIGENPSNPNYKAVTVKNLEAAPLGAIIVWDLHYSTRLAGDVLPQYLVDHTEFVELLRIGFANRGEAVVVLEKAGPDTLRQDQVSAQFADAHPKYLPAIMARSFRLLALYHFEEALAKFDYALQFVQNDPDLWFGKGYALLNLGRFDDAALHLHNAVTLAPRFPTAWYNLGRAYAGANELAAAEKAYNEGLRIDPEDPEAWFSLGAVRAKAGNLYGAISSFTETLRINPQHLSALNNRAAAYAMTKQPDLALADLNRAEKLAPGDLETMFMRGRVTMLSGQKDAGCAIISQAIAMGFDKAKEFYTKTCSASAPDSVQLSPK